MVNKLAILGASYLQLPLVKKAKEMGIETHCFAWDNDLAICKDSADFFYPISVLEKEQILEKCVEKKINGIVTVATDICMPTISYVAEKMGLISNSYKSSILATNKALMRNAFKENLINSPNSIAITNFFDINNQKFNFPLIVKPTDRSGSRGVTKVYNESELEIAVNRGINESIEKKVVIEEFIEGCEVSVEAISWEGKHYILTITDKVTTNEPFFVELEHHQPSLLEQSIQQKIKDETIKALDALDIKFGASHSEFKITKEGEIFIIEVGARMGGDFIGSDLVKLSTGYDFVKGVIEVALGNFIKPTIIKNEYSGVYFLSSNTNRLIPYFSEINEFEVKKSILKDELLSVKESNDRSGYLIYHSKKNRIIL